MKQPLQAPATSISFREFWEYIALQLGDAWLSLNPEAQTVNELVTLSYDPKDYLKQAILQSYKRSACQSLNSNINMNAVLDTLGEIAYTLRAEKRDDLFDIELLEEIAWHIASRFRHLIKFQASPASHTGIRAKRRQNATVISFPDYRIRKANAQF